MIAVKCSSATVVARFTTGALDFVFAQAAGRSESVKTAGRAPTAVHFRE